MGVRDNCASARETEALGAARSSSDTNLIITVGIDMESLRRIVVLSTAFMALSLPTAVRGQPAAAPDTSPSGIQTQTPNALRTVQNNKVLPDIFVAPSSTSDREKAPALSSIANKLRIVIEQRDVIVNNVHGIEIRVANNGDRPVVFDGERAVATVGSARYLPSSSTAIEPKKSPPDNFKGKLKSDAWATASSAALVGAVQTIQDAARQEGPILGRYGQDEARRRNETSSFGKRIVWPGDTSEGVIYFGATPSLQSASLTLPVNTLYNEEDQTVLTAGAVN